MLFLSPGIVYLVPTLLHWCVSNVVGYLSLTFQECTQTLPQKVARNKIKAYTDTAFLKIFRVVQKKDKKCHRNRLPTF